MFFQSKACRPPSFALQIPKKKVARNEFHLNTSSAQALYLIGQSLHLAHQKRKSRIFHLPMVKSI